MSSDFTRMLYVTRSSVSWNKILMYLKIDNGDYCVSLQSERIKAYPNVHRGELIRIFGSSVHSGRSTTLTY